jgi:uncharacterized protein YbjT (DUF2867 family)
MFVIAGATGNTGSVVAHSLLGKGRKVRVLVRDAAKAEAWRARGADVAGPSLDDRDALSRALEGAQGAYFLSPPDMASSDPLTERKRTADVVATALDKSGVPHVVFLSSIGAQHAEGTGIIRVLHHFERRLAATRARLTFLRAGYFLENWGVVAAAARAGKLPTFFPPDLRFPMVATRDIGATAAAALLEGPPAASQVVELAGPRELSSRDVAAAFSKVLGRAVEVEAAPLAAVVPVFAGFGVSAAVAEQFRLMYQGVADGTVAWEGGGARSMRGTVDAETVFSGLLR